MPRLRCTGCSEGVDAVLVMVKCGDARNARACVCADAMVELQRLG